MSVYWRGEILRCRAESAFFGMGGALPEFLRMAREGHEEKERCSFGLKYPISPMPDDETLPCGDLWEEISQDDPREGTPGAILTGRMVPYGYRPAPLGGTKKRLTRCSLPHSPFFHPGRDGLGGRRRKSVLCLPNLFIEQGYFLLFKVVYHSIKVAIRLSHIMYSTDSSVTGCNPGCCARVFSGTDRSRF